MRTVDVINRSINPYREPAVYYAEASTYLDAMDYAEFMFIDGWRILVPPFVTRTERIAIQKYEQPVSDWIEQPVEWGFVLHKFHETDVL